MYALRLLLASLVGLAISVSATPVAPRQLGSLACNIARIKIVADLASAGGAISSLAAPATQTAVQAGLDQANGGIKTIASSLLSGSAAPDEARSQVKDGLTAMSVALAAADA